MELNKIKGIGKSTIEKLKASGYTDVEDLKKLDLTKLIKLGVNEKLAKKILQSLNNLNNHSSISKKDDFNLEKENKYIVAGFKASEYYNKNLKGNELKKAFEKFKGE